VVLHLKGYLKMLQRIIVLCIVLFAFSPFVTYSQTSLHTHKYDKQFKSSFSRWLPGINYKWLKAQCWQESRFNPYAVSPVGAKGLCQFMPGTASDVAKAMGNLANPFNAKWSIESAAYYDSKMFRFWRSKRPLLDRLKLMLASYNAGAGNLLKAQKRCGMKTLYNDIIQCLPLVTKHHSKETIDYVQRIQRYRNALRY
jgi:soluble lytic murein transglycosylase-like protein